VHFLSLFRRKLLFGSQAVQYPKGSDALRLEPALASIRLMRSLCWPLCRFAVSASREWRKDIFQSIAHCTLRGLCCWARRWMLQVMDNMEASCVFYVKVGTFTHLEQSKISHLKVKQSRIETLTVRYDMIVSVIFMLYPGDYLRQTSADVLSFELHPINIQQLSDSGGLTP